MNLTALDHTFTTPGTPAVGLARGICRLVDACQRWYWRRATLRELARLGSHELRDIGLVRDDLWWVADQVARGLDPRSPRSRA